MNGPLRTASFFAAAWLACSETCSGAVDGAACTDEVSMLQLKTAGRIKDSCEAFKEPSRGACYKVSRARAEAKRLAQIEKDRTKVAEPMLAGPASLATKTTGSKVEQSDPPSGIERKRTAYGHCDCGTGVTDVAFWPNTNSALTVSVSGNSVKWVQFSEAVTSVQWTCGGSGGGRTLQTSLSAKAGQWVSMQVVVEEPTSSCSHKTSLVKWNTWAETNYTSSIPFTTTTDGYNCFKIPAMLRTAAGTFIAFSEARTPDCSDFAQTDLVYKRSTDGGRTWSKLNLLVTVSAEEHQKLGVCGKPLVIGNTAPVQISSDSPKHAGRILAPYTRNNYQQWIVHSDDDGVTFVGDRAIRGAQTITAEPDCGRNMTSYFGFKVDQLDIWDVGSFDAFVRSLCYKENLYEAYKEKLAGPWQFLGVGPPGSLQLRSGRILVPGYHSYIRGIEGTGILPVSQLFNNFALGHVLISDDFGDTWRMSDKWGIGNGANEHQMVELSDGTILANLRSLSTGTGQNRLQARSTDNGETFQASTFVSEQTEPFNGCQGSTMRGATPDTVYVASPDPVHPDTILQGVADTIGCGAILTGRTRVTVWKSTDGGRTYPTNTLIDKGASAQTSLQFGDGKLYLLYEQADPEEGTYSNYFSQQVLGDLKVLLPSRFVFREVPV